MSPSHPSWIEDSLNALLFAASSLLACVVAAAVLRRWPSQTEPSVVFWRRRSGKPLVTLLIDELRVLSTGVAQMAAVPGYSKWGKLTGYVAGVCLLSCLPLWPMNSTGGRASIVLGDELFVVWCALFVVACCRYVANNSRSVRALVGPVIPAWALCLVFLEFCQTAQTSSMTGLVSYQAEHGLWLIMTQPVAALCCVASIWILIVSDVDPRSGDPSDDPLARVNATWCMLHVGLASYVLALVLFGGWHFWGVNWAASGRGVWQVVLGFGVLHVKVLCIACILLAGRRRWWLHLDACETLLDVTCRVLPAVALGSMLLAVSLAHSPRLSAQPLLRATIGWLLLTIVLAGFAKLRSRQNRGSEELSL